MLKHTVAATVLALALAAPAAAQNEDALKAALEGHRVTLKMDMPGTSEGVDVHADARRTIDFGKYKDDLKRYGIAIHAGESVPVTLIKIKKDLIEFQLGGGGFGTFGDDTSTSVYLPQVDKSDREKELEKRIKDEDDRDRRRRMERELDDLRDRRDRENRRIAVERERLIAQKRDHLMEERMRGGSRFNVRYEDRVPTGMRPDDLMAALAEYVDFGGGTDTRPAFVPAPLPAPMPPAMTAPAGDISLLRKGLLRAEAERAFGRPVSASERREGGIVITTLVFSVGEQRVSADFLEDVLVRYTITSR
ncbi:MAG TPA: hypothetical protein VKI43_17135 [Vicinamibacterales bacterium]|nr:hypothetical protein [Vicinamibacterales bacterium]